MEDLDRFGTVDTIQAVYDTYGPVRALMPEIAALLLSVPEHQADEQPFIDGLQAAGCTIASPSHRKKTSLALERVALLVQYEILVRACLIIASKRMGEAEAWRKSAFFIYDLVQGLDAPVEAFEGEHQLID